MCVCVCVCVCVCMLVPVRVCMYVCVYECAHVSVCDILITSVVVRTPREMQKDAIVVKYVFFVFF